jgi:hypothetical protein
MSKPNILASSVDCDAAKPCREKYWEELTDSEKIERMRGVIKSYRDEVSRMQSVIRKLTRHKHNNSNMPIFEEELCYYAGGECEQVLRNKNEVYF